MGVVVQFPTEELEQVRELQKLLRKVFEVDREEEAPAHLVGVPHKCEDGIWRQ